MRFPPDLSIRTLLLGVGALSLEVFWLSSAGATVSDEVSIGSRYVHVRDVARDCAGEVCTVLLGRAPPAGSSSSFTSQRVLRQIQSAGVDPKQLGALPRKVRVHSRAKRLSSKDWGQVAHQYLLNGHLPGGLSLISSQGKLPLTLPAEYRLGRVVLPRLPRNAGPWATTAMIEILHEGELVRKAPVVLRLEVEEKAVRSTIRRGQGLSLVVARRTATITMRGVSLKDGEIGEVVPCRVSKTGRVVKARLRSPGVAEVVEFK